LELKQITFMRNKVGQLILVDKIKYRKSVSVRKSFTHVNNRRSRF